VRLVLLFTLSLLVGCGDPEESLDAAPDAGPEADASPIGQGGPPHGELALNEVYAGGPDWIEIVNRSEATIDASGWFVTDDPDRLDHYYAFPAGTLVAAGGRLVVYADDGAAGAGHHAPFKLAASDGAYLITAAGLVADGLLFLAEDGASLARIPDGEGLFYVAAPTPAAPNPEALP
jgi:hypothetical protein